MILVLRFEPKFDRPSVLRARESEVNDDRRATKRLPACPQTDAAIGMRTRRLQ